MDELKPRSILLLASLAAAACVPPAQRPPQQPPQAQPQPRPVQPVPPLPAGRDWRDLPLTPGAWYYSSQPATTQAMFGPANSEAAFIVRCDRVRRQVTLSREGIASGNTMTVRTSSGARNLPLSVQTEPLPYVSASLSSSDRFLDDIVFSRGRFTVEVPGTAMLVIPAWPEPARVVEDCRA